MRVPTGGPRGREASDGTTSRSPAPAADGGATAGAESGAVLELRGRAVGGVPQPASADAAGRGDPGHAGGATLPNGVLRAVPAGVSPGRGRRAGAAAWRVWARRHCAGRAAPLSGASERA